MPQATTRTNSKSKSIMAIAKDRERRLVEYFVVVSSLSRRDRGEERNGRDGKDDDEDMDSISRLKSNNYSERSISSGESDISEDEEDEDEFIDDYDFQPVITSRYPLEDHKDNPLHDASVSPFCHPTGTIQLRTEKTMPKIHSFVATGGSGKKIYGTCLTLYEPFLISSEKKKKDGRVCEMEVYLPKCLCILSNYPYLTAFREFLSQLNVLMKSGEMTLPVERYITNFCAEIPAPPSGSCELQTTIRNSVIKLWSPPHNQPIPWVSLPFNDLFQCLDLDNVLTIWQALALEYQVLLTSTQLSLLTTCSEIFLSLLFPMRWSHAYIPVLPHFLIPILSAPMPFFGGIYKLNLSNALLELSRECIVVDLDKNQVTMGPMTPPLPPIPAAHKTALRTKLEDKAGMVFREVRCLKRTDDYSERGIHLPSHVKNTADASWEGQLCLSDEAFHRYFTPEEARKNVLNGTDGSRTGEEPSIRHLTQKEKLANLKTQSKWDAVQEAFLGTYVYMLRNYRKYLVFPSKENEGSYGGAGFQSKQFVSAQSYAMQPFLKQLVTTQMFDDFITKRLYGSGAADVIFFDQAIRAHEKRASSAGGTGGLSRFRNAFRKETVVSDVQGPLLQSARVHRKLTTIVLPEPSGADLQTPEDLTISDFFGGAIISTSSQADDTLSVGSNSTGGGSKYSFKNEKSTDKYFYTYPSFPSKLNPSLFGTARPLPSAVLSEFDRQREESVRFRRRTSDLSEGDQSTMDMNGDNSASKESSDPQIATFTVFFSCFTSVVGRELIEISDNPRSSDRVILSNYEMPPPAPERPRFPIPIAKESFTESFSLLPKSYSSATDAVLEKLENEVTTESKQNKFKESMKTSQKEAESTFSGLQHVEDRNIADEHDLEDSGKVNGIANVNFGDMDMKEKGDSDSVTSTTDDSTIVSAISEVSDVNKKVNSPPKRSRKKSISIDTSAMHASHKGKDITKKIPRNRFRDELSTSEIEEARETARAQLGLAFEILGMLRKRGLKADPESYQCLIDASGRCGDTERATTLLSWMHEDGIVADGVVYSCLVSAFSAENAWRQLTGKNEEDLPDWANRASVEMDWNKLRDRKRAQDRGMSKGSGNRFMSALRQKISSDPENDNRKIVSGQNSNINKNTSGLNRNNQDMMSKNIMMQIMLGENLLELIYPDISIDTDNEMCPRCSKYLLDEDVILGWTACDSQDYTTRCPNCTQRFVPHFCVQSSSQTFMGSRGPASPLFCERLSPWVLLKELRSVMSDREGIDNLLRPEWRGEATKNSTLWWNLVLSFMRYKLPFSFLLQGNFPTSLIAPTPESEVI